MEQKKQYNVLRMAMTLQKEYQEVGKNIFAF